MVFNNLSLPSAKLIPEALEFGWHLPREIKVAFAHLVAQVKNKLLTRIT